MMTQRETTIVELYNSQNHQEKPLKNFIHQWFEEKGRGVTHGRYTTQNTKMEGVQSYWYIKNKIDALSENDILTWQLASMRPGADANILASLDKPRKRFEIMFCHQSGGFDKKDIFKLISSLLDYITPTYGVAYSLKGRGETFEGEEGPMSGQGEVLQRTEAWDDYYESPFFKPNTLKDLYSFNLLNKGHLERPVGESSLKEWIEGSRDRGGLIPVSKDLTLWEVKTPSTVKKGLISFINHPWFNG